MNNNEAYWKSLTSDNKKILLNNLLSMNNINILITLDRWDFPSIEQFINKATYDDVLKLPNFIKELIGQPIDKNFPKSVLYYNKNREVFFWNDYSKLNDGLISLLTIFKCTALNNPQIFDTIPNKQQYLHLIETFRNLEN